MAFDDLKPQSKEYIETLVANVEATTHHSEVVRYSGDISEPRARLVQKATNEADDCVIWLEGFSSGDAFQRLVTKGFLKGGWATPDTWEGSIDESALVEYRTGQG